MDLSKIAEHAYTWVTTEGFKSCIKLVIGVVVLFIGWKLINYVLKIFITVMKKKNIDPTLTSFAHAFADIALKILLVICFISYIGIDTASFAAIIASAGLAVGLALQGSLSNFAGGVIILLLRPFNVGDFIESSLKYSGVVERISIFYTHILTGDNKEVMIPNGSLVNGSVINYSSKPTRRVDLTFSAGYEDDIIKVKNVLFDIINKNELILKEPEPFVAVCEHAASSVNFVVRVWTKSEDYWAVHYALLETVKLRFDEEGINIPYPQMDIHNKVNI